MAQGEDFVLKATAEFDLDQAIAAVNEFGKVMQSRIESVQAAGVGSARGTVGPTGAPVKGSPLEEEVRRLRGSLRQHSEALLKAVPAQGYQGKSQAQILEQLTALYKEHTKSLGKLGQNLTRVINDVSRPLRQTATTEAYERIVPGTLRRRKATEEAPPQPKAAPRRPANPPPARAAKKQEVALLPISEEENLLRSPQGQRNLAVAKSIVGKQSLGKALQQNDYRKRIEAAVAQYGTLTPAEQRRFQRHQDAIERLLAPGSYATTLGGAPTQRYVEREIQAHLERMEQLTGIMPVTAATNVALQAAQVKRAQAEREAAQAVKEVAKPAPIKQRAPTREPNLVEQALAREASGGGGRRGRGSGVGGGTGGAGGGGRGGGTGGGGRGTGGEGGDHDPAAYIDKLMGRIMELSDAANMLTKDFDALGAQSKLASVAVGNLRTTHMRHIAQIYGNEQWFQNPEMQATAAAAAASQSERTTMTQAGKEALLLGNPRAIAQRAALQRLQGLRREVVGAEQYAGVTPEHIEAAATRRIQQKAFQEAVNQAVAAQQMTAPSSSLREGVGRINALIARGKLAAPPSMSEQIAEQVEKSISSVTRKTGTTQALAMYGYAGGQKIADEAWAKAYPGIDKASLSAEELAQHMELLATAMEQVNKKTQRPALNQVYQNLVGRSPTLFQRALYRARGRQGNPFNEPTLSEFAGRHALNTLGYAVPGIAIGIGFEELHRIVEEATQAQESLAILQNEFNTLGQGSQFAGFSNSITKISDATGVAVNEVADLALAMKGVYGSTQQATIALQGVAEATVTMDLTTQEAQEDLTALSQGFSDLKSQGGQAMTAIQNLLLNLQYHTGVTAKSLASGISTVASSANQVGFNSAQTSAIVAAAAQHSGLSAEVIGETFGKLIEAIPQMTAQFYQTFMQTPSLANNPQYQNLLSQPLSRQIQLIMAGFNQITSPAQKTYLLSQLGINSSALPAANALFQTGTEAARLATLKAPSDLASKQFAQQVQTIPVAVERVQQAFTNLGVEIVNSAVGHDIAGFLSAIGSVVTGLTGLGKKLGPVGDDLENVALAAGATYAVWKVLPPLLNVFGLNIGRDNVAVAENTVANEANTEGKVGSSLVSLGKFGLATAGVVALGAGYNLENRPGVGNALGGIALNAAGGAGIGFAFGGPVGAGIGAAAGAALGGIEELLSGSGTSLQTAAEKLDAAATNLQNATKPRVIESAQRSLAAQYMAHGFTQQEAGTLARAFNQTWSQFSKAQLGFYGANAAQAARATAANVPELTSSQRAAFQQMQAQFDQEYQAAEAIYSHLSRSRRARARAVGGESLLGQLEAAVGVNPAAFPLLGSLTPAQAAARARQAPGQSYLQQQLNAYQQQREAANPNWSNWTSLSAAQLSMEGLNKQLAARFQAAHIPVTNPNNTLENAAGNAVFAQQNFALNKLTPGALRALGIDKIAQEQGLTVAQTVKYLMAHGVSVPTQALVAYTHGATRRALVEHLQKEGLPLESLRTYNLERFTEATGGTGAGIHGQAALTQAARERQAALAAEAQRVQTEYANWSDIETLFEAGGTSVSAMTTALQGEVAAMTRIEQKTPSSGNFSNMVQAIQARNQALSQILQSNQQLAAVLAQSGSAAAQQALITQFTNPAGGILSAVTKQNLRHLTSSQAQSEITTILGDIQTEISDEMAAAVTPQQAVSFAQAGVKVSPQLGRSLQELARKAGETLNIKNGVIPGPFQTATTRFQAAQATIAAQYAEAIGAASQNPVLSGQLQLKQLQAQLAAAQQTGYGLKGTQNYKTILGQILAQQQTNYLAEQQVVQAQTSVYAAIYSNNPIVNAQLLYKQYMQAYVANLAVGNESAALGALASAKQEQATIQAQTEQTTQAQLGVAVAATQLNPLATTAAAIKQAMQAYRYYSTPGPHQNLQEAASALASVKSGQATQLQNVQNITQAQGQFFEALLGPDGVLSANVQEKYAKIALAFAEKYQGGANSTAGFAAQASLASAIQSKISNQITMLQAQGQVQVALGAVAGQPYLSALAQQASDLDVYNADLQKQTQAYNSQKSYYQRLGVSLKQFLSANATLTQQFATYQQDKANTMAALVQQDENIVTSELTLGTITTTQGIAVLYADLQKVKGNQQETLQLETEIRQLQNQAGSNLSFNLPSTLVPSTLYGARIAEATAGGMNMTGNKVSVTIYTSGGGIDRIHRAIGSWNNAMTRPRTKVVQR